jgi:hypothetical protein
MTEGYLLVLVILIVAADGNCYRTVTVANKTRQEAVFPCEDVMIRDDDF